MVVIVFGAIAAVFTGLSYAELSSIFPKAAAEYVFVRAAFRNNFVAFIIGWLTVITAIITAATVALGFGGYLHGFVDTPITIAAILLLLALSVVNFFGIRESAWTNTIFTIIEAAGLALIIYIGFAFGQVNEVDYFEAPFGINGIVLAFVLMFFAFIGFENMANIAEEVKNPKKIIPRAIILAIVITTTIYILVSVASLQILSWQELGKSTAPLADVASKALGKNGQITLSAIALFATTNTVLIILVAGARVLYGIARERSLPYVLSRVHYKTKTPWVAVIVIMVASIAFVFIGDIVIVANLAVFAIILTFSMINASVILLRYVEPNTERPFRTPLNVGKFPVLPLLGLATSVYMGFQFDVMVVIIGATIVSTGALFYLIYNKIKRT